MSQRYSRGGGRGRRGGGSRKQEQPKPDVDESSPLVQQFLQYQRQLDTRHDKHERLVKLSRDVTIESKRTIFLLQRISGEQDLKTILPDAEKKLSEIQAVRWRPIAEELEKEDPYKFLKAYSPGLQEYIEALSFYHFLKHGQLISPQAVCGTLIFPRQNPQFEDGGAGETGGTAPQPQSSVDMSQVSLDIPDKESDQSKQGCDSHDQQTDKSTERSDPNQSETLNKSLDSDTDKLNSLNCPNDLISVHIPPIEYVLGIADLTGEIMRMAIHSIGSGDVDKPFELCRFLRSIYDAFITFGNVNRELNRKLFTLKQSLQKVETACYTLKVRGSEIPKQMLADALKSLEGGHAGYEEGDMSID